MSTATKKTPQQIADAYGAAIGRRCEYVGGGRIAVRNTATPTPVTRYVTTREAAESLARRAV